VAEPSGDRRPPGGPARNDRPVYRAAGEPEDDAPLDFGAYDPPPGPHYRNGLGTAALVVGVLGLVTSWTVLGGLILGVTAIVLGILGRARVRRTVASNRGSAITGIVTGAVSVALALLIVGLLIRGFATPRGQALVTCVQQANGDGTAVNRCLDAYRSAGNG